MLTWGQMEDNSPSIIGFLEGEERKEQLLCCRLCVGDFLRCHFSEVAESQCCSTVGRNDGGTVFRSQPGEQSSPGRAKVLSFRLWPSV